MTHSRWVEKLLNVCRVDITLRDVTEWIRVMIGGSSEWMGWRTHIHMTHSWWVWETIQNVYWVDVLWRKINGRTLWWLKRSRSLFSWWIGLKSELRNSECLLNWCNIHCEMNDSLVSVRDGKWVEDLIWPLKFVRVELWVVLSRCNSMKGQFSGPVRWTRVRSLFMMWLSWRTHMTHSWWVEKLLNVCRVDVTLWKVSAKWMSLWDGRELGICSWLKTSWRTHIIS